MRTATIEWRGIPMARATVLSLSLLAAVRVAAQAPPSTDIWIVPMSGQGERITFSTPRNLTSRAGYDNQPGWSPKGDAIYFSSGRGDGQNDIWRVDIATGMQSRVTTTSPESEYSPTVMPGGAALSVVKVETDSAQRLWRVPLDGTAASVILTSIKPVGYHAWADANTLGLFVLGNAAARTPATFQIADTRTGTARIVARNIGRGIAKVPSSVAISFVDKTVDQEWWIMRHDVATDRSVQVARTLPGVEDYAWTPAGVLLMAKDSQVFAWTRAGWAELANFSGNGVQNITRMSVSPGGEYLAFVARDK